MTDNWPTCTNCGAEMNPVEQALSSDKPTCGSCIREKHEELIKQ